MTKLALIDPRLFKLSAEELDQAISSYYKGNPGGFKSLEALTNERERRREAEAIRERLHSPYYSEILEGLERQARQVQEEQLKDQRRLAKLEAE